MWELAPQHNALLIFAEHRYYGESKPFPDDLLRDRMGYLTSEQAMADYAELMWELKDDIGDPYVPIIGFGGSYGGMLATWFRMKYPHLLDGAIAGSAPIWTYYGEDPPFDSGGFAEVVTQDASPEGGSASECATNSRAAWATLFDWGTSEEGRVRIASSMRLCSSVRLQTEADVDLLAEWAQEAWDYLAMGNYPYRSAYILNGEGFLPPFPVRVACEHLSAQGLEGEELLASLASAIGVFYNFTGALECFDPGAGAGEATKEDADFWGFQYCTEQFQPFSRDGVRDMFWDQPFDAEAVADECDKQWAVRPDPLKASIEWGGRRLDSTSNIVFSNGGFDPWSSGGVLESLSDTLVSVFIPEGAHHLDLMFSNDEDPESVIEARKIEEHHVRRWIKEARRREWREKDVPAEMLRAGKAGLSDDDAVLRFTAA